MSDASETHNRLAPELVKQLIQGTANEVDALIVLESVVLGVMLFHRPKRQHAAEFLDVLTERVIERMV